VTVQNEVEAAKPQKRVRRSFLNWGTFLIALGAIPLAVQLGVLDPAGASQLLRFWPLIFIGIGIGLLLRFTPFDAVGVVLSAATFGVLLGSLIAGGFPGGVASACNASRPTSGGPPLQHSGQFSGGSATLNLELTCAGLDITRQEGMAWNVDVTAVGDPTIEAGANSLSLGSPKNNVFNPFGNSEREKWNVVVPTEQALNLNMTLNAATGEMDVGNGPISSVNATFNGSDVDLSMFAEGTQSSAQSALLNTTLNASSVRMALPLAQTSGSVTVNASSLDMCVPAGAAIRVDYHGTLSSDNFAAAGLVQSGQAWQSTNYDTADARIALGVTANVSSITLNPTGGCR
jgi:hypothetical protein